MAKKLHAIQAYSPRIKAGLTVTTDEVVSAIAGRSTYTEGEVQGMLMEFREVLLQYFRAGKGVRLEGLGIFAPKINMEGAIGLIHWPDRPLIQRLNKRGGYTGKILNRNMIGKSTEDLIARWNEEHPDDPIEEVKDKGKKDKKK